MDPAVLDDSSDDTAAPVGVAPPGVEDNVITSVVADGFGKVHAPVLDLDFPARLVPSSTPGHFHLYLDGILVGHEAFMRLLDALAEAGVVSHAYAGYSKQRGYTAVRAPGSYKNDRRDLPA